MAFDSILFLRPYEAEVDTLSEPTCLHDLNLDQVVTALTAGREQYELARFFYAPLRSVEAVRYRHEAMQQLEAPALLEAVREFARAMLGSRQRLEQAQKLHYEHQRKRLFLSAVSDYCRATRSFARRLYELDLDSRGFLGLRDYLASYLESAAFRGLLQETEQVRAQLAEVRYAVHVRGVRVTVGRYEQEPDYSAQIEQTFAKFRRGESAHAQLQLSDALQMNHVEAQIVDRVALLYPEPFAALDRYCEHHGGYLDPVIGRFEREIQFYLAYLEFSERLKRGGLRFCYPRVSARSKEIAVEDGFDLALAAKRVSEGEAVVPNDFGLSGRERILVVTGPNNGGKTTFARMVGQLHYLAALGLPVPAARARLFLPDRVFTHFEREEDITTLRGKLDDELVRIRQVLTEATDSSVIVMNESFSATTLSDALFLGSEILRRVLGRDCVGVYVTFVDELSSLSEKIVSVVAAVAPDDPTVRTYRVLRQPANGVAYAAAIAETYGLTYESLRRRVET